MRFTAHFVPAMTQVRARLPVFLASHQATLRPSQVTWAVADLEGVEDM